MATSLPSVKPLACNEHLSFTEIQRIVSDLMARDRVLEKAFLELANAVNLDELGSILTATRTILGQELMQTVIDSGALPDDTQSFDEFQRNAKDRLDSLEKSVTFDTAEGETLSVKALALNNQANIQAINKHLDIIDQTLEDLSSLVEDIETIREFVDNADARLSDVESLASDTASEVKNARAEFRDQKGKRLIDKINAMDTDRKSLRQLVKDLTKEITDARSPDRFDSLAERIGSLEGALEKLEKQISALSGSGTVTGIKVGRTILTGIVELIPGTAMAIQRERNGMRLNVGDTGTCVDYGAPKIDPNNGCCGPNNPNFAN